MKLRANYLHILRHSHTVRWAVAAGVFDGANAILPLFGDFFPRGLFAGLAMVCAIGAVVARLRVNHRTD